MTRAAVAARGRPARIVVVAADPLDGRGLALLLRTWADFDTIWAESMPRAGRLLGNGRREAILWSGDELDAAALDGVREVCRDHRECGLCAVADRADATALEAFLADGAGPFALVLRDARTEVGDLVATVETVLRGRSLVEPRVLERLLAVPAGGDGAVLKTLTAGEREILGLVADGLRNRAIAQRLFKSEKAVERHVGQIFCKLGLQPNGNGDIDRRVSAARMFLVQTGAVPGADARQR